MKARDTMQVHLVYDQERNSPKRPNGHWLSRVEAETGAELALVLWPFANVWNRQPSQPTPEARIACVSDEGWNWRTITHQQTGEQARCIGC